MKRILSIGIVSVGLALMGSLAAMADTEPDVLKYDLVMIQDDGLMSHAEAINIAKMCISDDATLAADRDPPDRRTVVAELKRNGFAPHQVHHIPDFALSGGDGYRRTT